MCFWLTESIYAIYMMILTKFIFCKHLTVLDFIMTTKYKYPNTLIMHSSHLDTYLSSLLEISCFILALSEICRSSALCCPHLINLKYIDRKQNTCIFHKELLLYECLVFLLKHLIPLFSYQGDIFYLSMNFC